MPLLRVKGRWAKTSSLPGSFSYFQLQGQPGQRVLCFYFLVLPEPMKSPANVGSISILFISNWRFNDRKFISHTSYQLFLRSENGTALQAVLPPAWRQTGSFGPFSALFSPPSPPQIGRKNHQRPWTFFTKILCDVLLAIVLRKLSPCPSESSRESWGRNKTQNPKYISLFPFGVLKEEKRPGEIKTSTCML